MNLTTELQTLTTAEENGVALHACVTRPVHWMGGYHRCFIVAGPNRQILAGWELIYREAGEGIEGGMRLVFGECPGAVENLVRERFEIPRSQ